MKFVDRDEELELLNRYYRLSERKLIVLGIYGLRRVGKTRLVREFVKNKKYVYFFINPGKSPKSLLKEFEREIKVRGVPDYVKLTDWRDFIRVIFDFFRGYVVIFDEFQYFSKVAPEVFGYFQKEIDSNEEKPIMLIFIGSLIGMMKDLFTNRNRPLYGRVSNLIHLKPFSFINSVLLANEAGIRDLRKIIELYTIFGGFPRYWEAIKELELPRESTIKIIERLFVSKYAPFIREGFYLIGEERKTYLSILEAIAIGLRKLSEIASYLGIPETQLSGPISELVEKFEVVIRERPVFAPKRSKISMYRIGIPALKFWFRFLYRNWSLLELGEYDVIMSKIEKELNEVIAEGFEDIAREIIIHYLRNKGEKIHSIGRWWRKGIEIDIIASCDKNNYAFEVKWSNLTGKKAINILYSLKEKTKHVGKEIKHIGILARKIEKKAEIRELGFIAIDLEDIKTIVERKTGIRIDL